MLKGSERATAVASPGRGLRSRSYTVRICPVRGTVSWGRPRSARAARGSRSWRRRRRGRRGRPGRPRGRPGGGRLGRPGRPGDGSVQLAWLGITTGCQSIGTGSTVVMLGPINTKAVLVDLTAMTIGSKAAASESLRRAGPGPGHATDRGQRVRSLHLLSDATPHFGPRLNGKWTLLY